MANLAEAAAHAIGANALLVRVGAYFHDLGKSTHPEFFIENQAGIANPHDQMAPLDSARAIFHHVTEGARLLRQHGAPEDIVEFAFTHHGTGVLEYFWHKNLKAGNPQELAEREFCYPGHKPANRETGILMLVDSIEAAARTVETPDKAQFEQLVQRIVYTKLSRGQLDESDLTLADTRNIANTVVDALVGVYHARIKYPWQTGDTANGANGNGTPSGGLPVVVPPATAAEKIQEPVAAPTAHTPTLSPGGPSAERMSAPLSPPPKP